MTKIKFEVVYVHGWPIGVGIPKGDGMHEMICNSVFSFEEGQRPQKGEHRRQELFMQRIAACLNACEGINPGGIEALLAACQKVVKTLPPPTAMDWWCPTCQAAIVTATNTEHCTHCGTYLGDCQPTSWINELREAARAALEEAGVTQETQYEKEQ